MSDQETVTEQQSAGFSIGLVWFVLFRRMRLVIAFLVVGLLAALGVWFFKLPVYRSSFELMMPYVLESKSHSPGDPERLRTSSGGDSLINAEMHVLRSFDLAEKVARSIGPEKLAPGIPSGLRLNKAAEAIVKNLHVEVLPKSIIIEVTFEHPDSTVVQPVLENLIERYNERHNDLHTGSGTNLQLQLKEAQTRLMESDKALRDLKGQVFMLASVEETKKGYAVQITKLQTDLMDAKAQLAMQRVLFKDDNEVKPTNVLPTNLENTVPDDIMEEFKLVSLELEALRARDFELHNKQFLLDAHPVVQSLKVLIAAAEAKKKKLIQEHPALVAVNVPVQSLNAGQPVFLSERDKRGALQAQIKVLEDFLGTVQTNAIKLQQLEPSIADAQRHRDACEASLRAVTAAIELKQFGRVGGAAQNDNISVVQAPTPAAKVASKRLKTMGMLFGGCLGAGLGLAFLLELFVDRTVKRPSEIEPNFKLPLLMAVPALHDDRNSPVNGVPGTPSEAKALVPASDSFVPAWSPLHFIHPYTEALSNRVAMYFEFVKRKPKLVGVTSCSDGAGVSSIAEGLAAALSESGDGRVLIVDMHRGQGATQTFFQGKPVAESAQLLNGENPNGGSGDQIIAATIGEGGNRTLPTGLKHLLPKLKASDYDYIIFDMPKISMASMSLRLSALLDLTVLVVESEKVQSDLLKRNCAMLTESGAKVGVVMNKVHKYVPEWLHSEV